MKMFFKRITILILVLSMLVGALPAAVFADDSVKKKEEAPTEFMDFYHDSQTGAFPGRMPRTDELANKNLYLLSVSLGAKGGEISGIIVSYYTQGNSSRPYRQILEVNRQERDTTTIESLQAGQAAFLDLDESWPFYGSKFATYSSLVGDASGRGDFVVPERLADGTVVETQRNFGQYTNAAKSIVPDVNSTKYPSAYQKAGIAEGSSAAFQANSTDCIAFRLQYKLDRIESISFICESIDGAGYNTDIIFSGWSLIQLDQATKLQATNFAFLSDRLGLIYDGKVICQSTQKTNERLKDGIRVTENRVITFFNKDKLSVAGFDYENESYPGSDDTYRTDISGASDCYTLCCTDNQNEIIQTDNPTLKKLDFVVTFADLYGAGIEEFNVSPVAGVRNSNYLDDYSSLLSANGSDLVAGYIDEEKLAKGEGEANMPAGFVKLDGEEDLWTYVRWGICNALYAHTKDTILGQYWPDGDTFSSQRTMQVISFAHGMRRAMEEYGIEITSDIPPEPIFANTSGQIVSCEDLLNTHALNLSDVLDAQIEYVDIYGVSQTVNLPVVSNSLLNAGLDGYENGIEDFANSSFAYALRTGEYLEYAQQGQSISFSVEFPALKELKSISLSYFDPRVSDDAQIAISNIAVYDAEPLPIAALGPQNKKYEQEYNEAEAYYQACEAEMERLKQAVRDADQAFEEFQQTTEYMMWSGRQRLRTSGLKRQESEPDPIGDKFIALRAATVDTEKAVERYQSTLDAAKAARDRAKETYDKTRYVSYPVLSDEYYEKNIGNGSISALPADAVLVYISDQSREEWIGNASNNYNFKLINLSDVPAEAREIPDFSDYTDTYLATIKTSDIKVASTRGDVNVTFKYKRLNNDGELVDAEAGPISIKEGIQGFDGYNIGVVVKDGLIAEQNKSYTDLYAGAEDAAYYYGMYQGNELTVMFNARGVEQFTGVSFDMDGSLDDWQVDDVSVYKVENMSPRQIHPLNSPQRYDSVSDDGEFSFVMNRYYDRTVYGEIVAEAHNMSLLLQGLGGESKASYSFTSQSAASSSERRIDDSEWEDEMPYEVAANMVHGYATEAQAYEVRVKVGSNSEYASGNDTCGSDNMYYFQLQFKDKDGKITDSGYVLANRQLSSDGFRSGVTESFTISANKDYGDVIGISIIPDDISSNSNPTDKLCIDEISVIKKNVNAPDKKYVFNNIGWISTEYRDTSEKTQKETRSEAELAQRFKTEYSAYMVNLEVALTWGKYEGDEGTQFEGDMTADIQYETSNGSHRSVEVQVVKAMYEYRNKTAPINTATGKYISDRNSMFVEETTDRFLVGVEDCYKINKIVFHAIPNSSVSIPFKGVEISVLKSDGTLAYASDGTYIRRYNSGYEPVLVAELESVPTKLYSAVYGQQNLIPFYLSSTPLPEFDEETTFASIPERVPAYGEDTINMLFYLAEGTPFPSEAHYHFTGGVRYARSNSPSNYYVVQAGSDGGSNNFIETRIGGRKVLALYGAPTQGISTIKDAYAYCDNIVADYYLGHVVIQQVRDNTIIDTKIINFADGGFGSSGKFSQEKGASSSSFGRFDNSSAKQEFTLMLGEGTPDMTLVEGSTDIAVQFKYKSKTVDRASYNSPIVFATDASNIRNSEGHNTLDIHSGSVLKFNFNEFDVQDVEQVIVKTVSDKGSKAFRINVGNTDGFAGATLICTEAVQDSDAPIREMLTGYYTFEFSGNISVSATGVIFKPVYKNETDSNAFRRVDITFGTQSASGSLDSAGKYPIKASIKYMKNKLPVVAMIGDIRNYISDVDGGSFDVDGKVTTTFMFPGYADIVSITVEPVDPDGGNASWNLGTITVQADGIDKEARTMKVDKHIVQGKPETILLNGQEQSPEDTGASEETNQ